MRIERRFGARILVLGLLLVSLPPVANGAMSPSNALRAFTQVPLSSSSPPPNGSGFSTSSGHPTWPTSLDNRNFILAIGHGDSALISTTRSQGVSISLDGSVTYTLPPNTYANRVATIVTANDWTNAGDGTLPMLTVSFFFADGRRWGSGTSSDVMLGQGKALTLINQVRNWSNQVNPSRPDFVMPPRDTSAFQLYGGLATSGPDSVFSDLQTFRIPDTLRNSPIKTITFSSYTVVDGEPITHTTGLISGLAVWPDFEIKNRHSLALDLQNQFGETYSGSAYGGYVLRDTLFGSRGTIRTFGCFLSCMAMANTFLGDSVIVPELNAYLVRHGGYGISPLVDIDSVVAQSIGSTVFWTTRSGVKLGVGDSVLIEIGRSVPLVTLAASSTPGRGTIVRRHRAGLVVKGMLGLAYGNVDSRVAADTYSTSRGRPWTLEQLGDNPIVTPTRIEAALTDSLPVLLRVRAGHFVLANGWRPSFGSDTAIGTYRIKDPGHDGVNRLNQIFTKNGNPYSFANRCSTARACVPADSTHFLAFRREGEITRMELVLQGGGTLGVIDPEGRFLNFNDLEGYVGNIPGVNAWSEFGAGLDEDPDPDAPVEFVQIDGVVEGDYRVVVSGAGSGTIGLTATAFRPDGIGEVATVTRLMSAGANAAFAVQVVPGAEPTVQIDTLGTTAVEAAQSKPGFDLVLQPNPSPGVVELQIDVASVDPIEIAIYDIAGRVVARPFSGALPLGRHQIHWNAGSQPGIKGGLYFVRLTSARASLTRRVVVTP